MTTPHDQSPLSQVQTSATLPRGATIAAEHQEAEGRQNNEPLRHAESKVALNQKLRGNDRFDALLQSPSALKSRHHESSLAKALLLQLHAFLLVSSGDFLTVDAAG